MDNLFKALLIIILVAFLYLYYENSNNDRYFFIERGAVIFDKRTGTLYWDGGDTGVEVTDYINGTKRVYPWNQKDNK